MPRSRRKSSRGLLYSLMTWATRSDMLKTQSLKGNEVILNKSFRTDNTITCNTLRCDNIDIDPSQPTIIKNAQQMSYSRL